MSKLNTVVNGKGSKPRITNKPKFDSNFDQIDWKRASQDKYKSAINKQATTN